jgi:hypothetical protein
MDRSETAMLATRPLDTATVDALRSVANRFGSADDARKLALLRAAADAAICDVEVLLAYHDVLLFLLAYPRRPRCVRERPASWHGSPRRRGI